MGHPSLIPDLSSAIATLPAQSWSGVVFRMCVARHAGRMLSVLGAFLHAGRYNVAGQFGVLYTSLEERTARREMARYFTVPPRDGFVQATIQARFSAVVDLTTAEAAAALKVSPPALTSDDHTACQAIGVAAWEAGFEAMLVASAAAPGEKNLAILADNQHVRWMLHLRDVTHLAAL